MSVDPKRAALLVALLVATIALFAVREPRSGEPAAGKTRSSPQAQASLGEPMPPPNALATGRGVPAPLPPVDAPLAVILEPLAARADAGDGKAACRLAMELIRCQAALFHAGITSFDTGKLEAELEASGKLDAADEVAANAIEQVRVAQECLAVPGHLQDRGPHYLGQAARAGEPEAMVRYADSQLWAPDGRGIFVHPEFEGWRRDAPGMIQRAFAAGVPESALVMMDAYMSDFGLVGAMIPNDSVKHEATRMLMARLHGWSYQPAASALDAAGQARAGELARQWHEGPFKGRNYRGQDRSMFQFAGIPKRGGAPHEFCSGSVPVP